MSSNSPCNITNWGPSQRFAYGFDIGSEGENGEHIQDQSGWPYSVYRKNFEIGGCDAVVCHGIQNLGDAERLCALLNADFMERFSR